MKHQIQFCIVILVASCGLAASHDAPEDVWVDTMFRMLGQNAELVVREFARAAPRHEVELQNILNRVTKADNGTVPDDTLGCKGCQLVITLLTYLVKMGYTMEDFQEPAESICYLLFRFINGFPFDKEDPGNKVCPGVITNFGHHVERIFRFNRYLPEESCFLIKSCSNELPTFTLPSLIGIVAPSSNSVKRWELPKRVHNYRTKRRAGKQRNWQEDEGILKIAQFTDIHVDEYYAEGAPTSCGMPLCCRDLPADWDPQDGAARPYGEYSCNVPPETTRLFLEKAKALQPDVVLYSGDSPPHHLWEETLDGQMNSTLWVAEELNQNFPDAIGIYSTLGNHECFPSNMYDPSHEDTMALHDTFIGAYQELSRLENEQIETLNKGGYYSVSVTAGLRIVAPNGNFGYTNNWYNLLHLNNGIYHEMVDWMRQTLTQARQDNEKVIILTHHPVHGNVQGYDETFTALMVEFSDIIVLNVVGHNHKDEFRVFRDDSGEGKGVQFLSQSANSYSDVNPGVRVYYHDEVTLELLGYEQYYLDITQVEGTPEVALLYKTDVDYSLDDLSAESMLEFASRMEADNDLFDKFYKNRVSGAETLDECNESCKRRTLCRQVTSIDADEDRCVFGENPQQTDPPAATDPSQTDPPAATDPSQTNPDETDPPQTGPSVTDPPATTESGVSGIHLPSFAYLLPIAVMAVFML